MVEVQHRMDADENFKRLRETSADTPRPLTAGETDADRIKRKREAFLSTAKAKAATLDAGPDPPVAASGASSAGPTEVSSTGATRAPLPAAHRGKALAEDIAATEGTPLTRRECS